MKKSKIAFILGTRPEIIKMGPILQECDREKIQYEIVFTDQHYDYELSRRFFEELEIRAPDFHLDVGSGTQAVQTAKAMIKIEENLIQNSPSIVVVQGDTNTVLAGGLTSAKLRIPVGHVEAGLRSNDFRMPEEINRRVVDHISQYLFAPTKITVENLKKENVWGNIYETGNTIIDACLKNYKIALKKSKILTDIDFKDFVLVTFHRAENVDDLKVLTNFVELLEHLDENFIFPIHNRTLKNLKKFRLLERIKSNERIRLMPPVGYLDMLLLLSKSKFILTDSGGIQEEVTAPIIQKKCFVLRDSTERPEAVEAGFVEVVGTDSEKARKVIKQTDYNDFQGVESPYGDGQAAKKIVGILKNILEG
ncbi:MAG: non-hydrolyzing UDP-N-acetylglucosamine 2-epimerase [Candidatus Helarchaeota archaeon]